MKKKKKKLALFLCSSLSNISNMSGINVTNPRTTCFFPCYVKTSVKKKNLSGCREKLDIFNKFD